MSETVPAFDPQIPATTSERRSGRRSSFTRAWNLIFAGLRRTGVHVQSFHGVVGTFLVVGVVIAILATLAFAEIGERVLAGRTQAFDVAILQWLHLHQTSTLTAVMIEVTYLGTGTVVAMTIVIVAMFLWHTEHKHSARLLLAATAGTFLLNTALKLVYHRPRPSVFPWQVGAMSSSFPSGHAMNATVVYGTVAYLCIRLQKHRWSRVVTLSSAVIVILLICVTRLYLGVHYPSDVFGGIVVGLGWAAFCMATLEASLALARSRAPREVVGERPAPAEAAASL